MVDATSTPSRIFPMPGWSGAISDHHGVAGAVGGSDLMVASAGTQAVVSMVSGTVQFISSEATAPNSGGNAVQIKGIDGLEYYYAHLSNSIKLKVGDKVTAGQMLGFAGNSGNAKTTPPHLHIGIGKSIQTGLGPQGGIGSGFNAVNMLRALVKQPSANNPKLATDEGQANLGSGGVITVPHLNFVPAVPGFSSEHQSDILTNIKAAIEAGVDPFVWLGIVARESSFNPNAKNPQSGACGYAQLLPCPPGLSPVDNAKEGLKRLKDKLKACNQDMDCALNAYSGGGGSKYINEVKMFASMIKGVNSNLPTDTDFSTDSSDSDNTNVSGEECPKVHIADLPGGGSIDIPDIGCELQKAVNQLQDQAAQWWSNWQIEHIPSMVLVLAGIGLIALGILLIASTQVNVTSLASTAVKGAVAA